MKFRKKPIVIEANQWLAGDPPLPGMEPYEGRDDECRGRYVINTLEGVMFVSAGDWIIKGVDGELYPCKPSIFKKTYERVKS